jgi:hypothetical protein
MKPMFWLSIPLLVSAGLVQAADLDLGDRMQRRWDNRGDSIDARLDVRATEQHALGHEQRADRLDLRGDRINARYDHVGQRHENRFDRRRR